MNSDHATEREAKRWPRQKSISFVLPRASFRPPLMLNVGSHKHMQRHSISVRDVVPSDYGQWLVLWDGYNAFYGRSGQTALPLEITASTWERFFDPAEPVFGVIAEVEGKVQGLAHYLFHRSTTKIEPVCYLQDLFAAPEGRGQGIGRALVGAVYERASFAGSRRVYWQTQSHNEAARSLYDKVAKHLGFIVYSKDFA